MTLAPLVLLALAGAGMLAGFVDAIAGGGGLIALPALLAAGVPPVAARIAGETSETRVLRVEGVNTFYGKSHILHDATLDVRTGEIVALLGRNGAGKSTLLKTLIGIAPPETVNSALPALEES